MSNSFHTSFFNQSFDQNVIRILYLKNKMYLFPCLAVIVGIILFFIAVVPQIQNYFLLKTEIKNSEEKITVLKSNVAVLSGINTSDLDSKLKTVVSALPVEKDFAGILQVIGQAATDSNVVLGDFSFSVGSVSSEATKVTNTLPIEVMVTITSDIHGTKRFLEALTGHFPLSEVTTLKITNAQASMKIIFYYKPLPKFAQNDNQRFVPISEEENALFETLTSFTSAASGQN